MICPFPPPASCSRRNLPSPDRLRHAQVGEAVEDDRPDMGFGHLPLKGTREDSVAQLLAAEQHVPSAAAPVVAAVAIFHSSHPRSAVALRRISTRWDPNGGGRNRSEARSFSADLRWLLQAIWASRHGGATPSSTVQVLGPTMPSGTSPRASWKRRIAASVRGPKLSPSQTFSSTKPCFSNAARMVSRS